MSRDCTAWRAKVQSSAVSKLCVKEVNLFATGLEVSLDGLPLPSFALREWTFGLQR